MGYDMHFHDQDNFDEPGYFCLNVSGMAWCYGEMTARKMIFDAGQHPPLPGWTGDEESYRKLSAPVLAWHGPEIPGIPEHKFGTNDGWLVTPAECEAAVRIGRQRSPPAQHADIWADWLDYMDRARTHGGFEVH